MENLNDLLYDDVEQKFIELQDKKKKRRKRWKRIKSTILIGGILIGSVYFFSDYSKVQSLSVTGNAYFSEQDILNMADLSYETRYVLMPKFLINWNLGKSSMIDSVEIKKTINGAIHLHVKEKKILGYYIADDGKTYMVAADTPIVKVEVTNEHHEALAHYPLLANFDDENLQKLADAFQQPKREVGSDVIAMISEILPHERSYDAHMVKIVMQDGNTIYSSYDGIPLLNDYKKVLRELTSTHVCLELDDTNASIVSKACE